MNNSGKKHVYLIGIITAICLLGDSMLYVVLPIHWEQMGLSSLWEVGVLLSINRFIRLPLNPFVEWIYRKISLRQGIIVAVVLASITTMSYGLFNTFWLLFIARCVWGFAWSFLRLGAFFAIIELSDDTNRGHFMGMYNGVFRLGSLFGMLFGGLIADIYNADVVAYIFGFAGVFAVPIALTFNSSAKIPMTLHKLDVSLRFSFWKSANFIWVVVSGALIAMLYQGIFTSSFSHLIDVNYSSHVKVLGVMMGAATLAGIVQALRWSWEPVLAPWFGRISDGRIGRKKMLGYSLFLASSLFFIIPLHFNIILWLIAILLTQLTATVLTTLMDALALDHAQYSSKRAMMTLYSMSTDVGAALGPILGFFITTTFGVKHTFWFASTIAIILSVRWIYSSKTISNQQSKVTV